MRVLLCYFHISKKSEAESRGDFFLPLACLCASMAIKFKSVIWQTYRELFPIRAGSIEDMVAGLAFHLSLEAKTVKIKSFQ